MSDSGENSALQSLQFAAISEEEKKKFREELHGYLDESRAKIGSDGEQLIHIPDDFDVVADAMDRTDLTSTEERPWSKYLLSQDNSFENSLDKEGRYADLKPKVSKLEKGLASMHMLDQQLKEASKLDKQLQSELATKSEKENMYNDDAASETSSIGSGRKSRRSVLSRFNDYTFLTRAKSDRSVMSEPELISGASTPLRSARSEFTTDTFEDGKSENDIDHGFHQQNSNDNVHESENNKRESDSKTMSEASLKSKTSKFDAKELKNRAMNGRASLSEEQELRLKAIMDADENSLEWKRYSQYGLDAEQSDVIKGIDTKLVEYGRGAYLESLENQIERTVSEKLLAYDDDNYLKEQRTKRQQVNHEQRLDDKLKSVKKDTIDLSGLLDRRHSDTTSDYTKDWNVTNPFVIPHHEEVSLDRKITLQDIDQLIFSLKSLQELGEDGGNEMKSKEASESKLDDNSIGLSRSSAAYCSVNMAPRQDIDRLLGSLRPEIDRLSDLRTALEKITDPIEGRISESANREIQDMYQQAVEGYKDTIEDLTIAYGDPNDVQVVKMTSRAVDSAMLGIMGEGARPSIGVSSSTSDNLIHEKLNAIRRGLKNVRKTVDSPEKVVDETSPIMNTLPPVPASDLTNRIII